MSHRCQHLIEAPRHSVKRSDSTTDVKFIRSKLGYVNLRSVATDFRWFCSSQPLLIIYFFLKHTIIHIKPTEEIQISRFKNTYGKIKNISITRKDILNFQKKQKCVNKIRAKDKLFSCFLVEK
jgi:hypothetical protein